MRLIVTNSWNSATQGAHQVAQKLTKRNLSDSFFRNAFSTSASAGASDTGSAASFSMILRWILLNGSLAAIGSLLCLAHPLTILVSFLMAPVATLNPFVGIGLFAGVAEAYLRKPRVQDFERLTEDVASLLGFYRNRVTHILLIFFLMEDGLVH